MRDSPEWQTTPLIILTDDPTSNIVRDTLSAGVDEFIVKSIDFAVAKAQLRNLLHRKQVADRNIGPAKFNCATKPGPPPPRRW